MVRVVQHLDRDVRLEKSPVTVLDLCSVCDICIYIHTYIVICVCMYIHIYVCIYIARERESVKDMYA